MRLALINLVCSCRWSVWNVAFNEIHWIHQFTRALSSMFAARSQLVRCWARASVTWFDILWFDRRSSTGEARNWRCHFFVVHRWWGPIPRSDCCSTTLNFPRSFSAVCQSSVSFWWLLNEYYSSFRLLDQEWRFGLHRKDRPKNLKLLTSPKTSCSRKEQWFSSSLELLILRKPFGLIRSSLKLVPRKERNHSAL